MRHFPLIWAALWRKPLETGLLLAAITCAFTLFGLMIGLRETTRLAIANNRADLLIINPRYDGPDGLPSAIAGEIARIDGVTDVALRTGVYGTRGDSRDFVSVEAVDEGMRRAAWGSSLTPEQWDRLFAQRSGVYVSRRIATHLNLHPGDRLTITSPNEPRADGGTTWSFDVLDLIDDELLRNGNLIIGNYHYVDEQRPSNAKGGHTSSPGSAHRGSAGRVAAIDRHFANSRTATASITFRAAEENMESDALGIAVMTWGIGSAGLFMILLMVANAIAQSVRERIPEFALLKAVGYREVQIAALVIVEALIPCVAGAVGGMGLARILSLLPRAALPAMLRGRTPTFSSTVWIVVLGLAALLALLGALTPALKLRRLRVATALVAA